MNWRQSLCNGLKAEFKTKNRDFLDIVTKCSILGVLLLFSILWSGFSYVALVLALIFAGTKFNGRSIYYIVFLLPLISIFKANRGNFYYLTYVIALVCVVLGVKLLLDVFRNKTKKLNWVFTGLVAVLVLYFLFRANYSNISVLLSLLIGLGLLFICYYYKEDLNFKELVFAFVLGMLFSTIIGLIFYNNSRLLTFIDVFSAYGVRRFQGSNLAVNVFAGEVVISIACLLVLTLRKEIKYVIYPLFVIFTICLMFTFSKASIIAYFTGLILFILIAIVINLKNKKALLQSILTILVLIGSLVLICCAFPKRFNICKARFVTSVDYVYEEQTSTNNEIQNNVVNNNKVDVKIDYTELSTGRVDIWKTYLEEISKTPKSLLFGYGVGQTVQGDWVMYTGTSTHNTIIQALYYSGVFGLLLMLATLISTLNFKKFKFKNFKYDGLIVLICTGLFLMGVDFFSFRLSVYLILILFSFLMNENEEVKIKEGERVLNLLASNKFSGAENVACQIIGLLKEDKDYQLAYASPDGEIAKTLEDKNIDYYPMKRFSIFELKRVIKEFQPTVIHAHDMKAICLASLFNRHIPIVAHIHRNHSDFHKISIRALLLKLFAKKKNFRSIIWVSDACLEDYVFKKDNAIQKKSVILYNIVNQEVLLKKAEIEDKMCFDLVFVGRLTDIKNPLRLIEITQKLKQKKLDISLGVIGSGDLMEECIKKAKELDLNSNIQFLGFRSDFYGVLKSSKLFILTSRTEGTPMSILEAQTFGLPAIVPQINGLEKVVKTGETGFLYNSDEEAVDCILSLLNNSKQYNEMKDNVLAFSQTYNDKQKYLSELKGLYKK